MLSLRRGSESFQTAVTNSFGRLAGCYISKWSEAIPYVANCYTFCGQVFCIVREITSYIIFGGEQVLHVFVAKRYTFRLTNTRMTQPC